MKIGQSWKVRDGDEKDLENILSLRKVVFGEMEEDKVDPRFWKWLFREGTDGKALIYLVEDHGRLAGHFSDIPRRFSVNGEVLLGTLSLDLMVHPDYRRQGIFAEMGRYAAQTVRSRSGLFMTAFPIRKETVSGLLKIGWETVGELPVLVYPIRFRGIIDRYLRVSTLSTVMGGMARTLYGLIWGWRGGKADQNIVVEEVTQLDNQFDPFWQKASRLYPVLGVRDKSFLNWRYFQNPLRTYTFYRSIENGEMTGYIVLRKVDLLNFNSAVVVDLLALNERAFQSLVRIGIEYGQKVGADLLGCMIPKSHPYYGQLKHLGFLPSPKIFLFMVYRLIKEKISLAPEVWYVNWGDTDVI